MPTKEMTDEEVDKLVEAINASTNDAVSEYDAVNKPEHYAGTKIEVIDYIEDKNLDFCLGNVVKYVSRAGRKKSAGLSDLEKEIQDLEKARWYLDRRIKELKEGLCN